MLSELEIKALLDEYESRIRAERERLDRIRCYINGDHDRPYRPVNSESDVQYNILARRATTNLLPMIKNASSQQLQVDGISTGDSEQEIAAWAIWQANGFDRRNSQLIDSALTYGSSYAYAIRDKKKDIVMRGKSARHMYALYDDPVADEFPEYAFIISEAGEIKEVWDDSDIHEITESTHVDDYGNDFRVVTIVDSYPHGAVVCPVVRYAPTMDLDGNCFGEIEPVFVVQDRVNQVSFDLLLVQHYGAFKLRGFSGVSAAIDTKTGKPTKLKLTPDTVPMLQDPDAKAWQLDGTDLAGYIAAFELAVHHLAVASQTPAHYMLGDMANLSADAIAAAEITLTRKVLTYKLTLGESVEQLLRLASTIAGQVFPDDAEVLWTDRESRSLSQVADALNKYLALGVPVEALWAMMPNVTSTMVKEWKKMRLEEDPLQAMVTGFADKTVTNNAPTETLPNPQSQPGQ